jgi:transcriptional regulator with XRE-family HTH domain
MADISKFHETLNEIMIEKSVSAQTLAAAINVAPMTVYRYLAGSRTPNIDNLIKLADNFSCTIDYLVGRAETNFFHSFKKRPTFAESFSAVLEKYKTSEYKLSKISGISRGGTFSWLSGKSEPTLDSLIRLADFFDCTIDFLIGREN